MAAKTTAVGRNHQLVPMGKLASNPTGSSFGAKDGFITSVEVLARSEACEHNVHNDWNSSRHVFHIFSNPTIILN